MRFKSIAIGISLLSVFALPAHSEALGGIEAELQDLGVRGQQLSKVANSGTMKAARKMCLLAAHAAHSEKAVTLEKFRELSGHCANGNFHKAMTGMGGTVADEARHSVHAVATGAVRHFDQWEYEATHEMRGQKKD